MSLLVASVMCLHFSIQEEDTVLLSMLMASVICVHFSQFVDHCITKA